MATHKRPRLQPPFPPWSKQPRTANREPPWRQYLYQYENAPPPPPWREPASAWPGNAARPAAKHTSGNRPPGSAAQPATNCGVSRAERPDHQVSRVGSECLKCDDRASRSEEEGRAGKKLLTSVAYLRLPASSRKQCTEDAARRCAIDVVRKAKQAGADIINIVFEREQDMDLMEEDLEAEMQATVKHPGFFHCRLAQLLTLFSADCGEVVQKDVSGSKGGMPVICITTRKSGQHDHYQCCLCSARAASETMPHRGYLQRISSMGVFGQASNSFRGASEERLGQGTGFWAASAA